jgi:hypothetical protein
VGYEVVNHRRSVASTSETFQSKQTRVSPTTHFAFIHEGFDFPFGENSVGDIEATVLPHVGFVEVQVFEELVVGLSPNFEFQSAEGVGDVFETVHDAVSVVVSGVDTPLVSRVRVGMEPNAVSNKVPHAGVGVLHVHLDSQRALSFLETALPHFLKQIEIFLD